MCKCVYVYVRVCIACLCVCVCVCVCMAARMGEILWLDMFRGCMCVCVWEGVRVIVGVCVCVGGLSRRISKNV